MIEKEKIWIFIKEYWDFIKKCYPLPKQDDNDGWDKIVNESDELYKKWDDGKNFGKFVRGIIVAWLEYIGKVEVKK